VVNQVQIGTRGGVHGDDRRHGFSLNEISLVLFEHQPSILLTLVLFPRVEGAATVRNEGFFRA